MAWETIRWRNLPHWDVPGAAYFVTTCLEGSIPARGLVAIRDYDQTLHVRRPSHDQTEAEAVVERWKLKFAKIDRWLDESPAVRWLDDPVLACEIVDAFYFFANDRYDLLAFVVMPSHLHWVFRPLQAWIEAFEEARRQTARERVVKSINQHTARVGNRRLRRRGAFWQHESYDHWVRDADEMDRIIRYVEANPVKAGLAQTPEAWPFSSAHDRMTQGRAFGEPLKR